MTTRPFHHGNLRAVLLEQGENMLRETGVDGISLRELARQAGVSHGAPRSHFVDKQSLLDALAERGFDRLAHNVAAAAAQGATFADRFRAVGHAYVEFAVDDAALMELMFAAKVNDPPEPVQRAAGRLFQTLDDLLEGDPVRDAAAEAARWRFKLLFASVMQGAATLMAAKRISGAQGDTVVDDAVDMLLASGLGRQVLQRN